MVCVRSGACLPRCDAPGVVGSVVCGEGLDWTRRADQFGRLSGLGWPRWNIGDIATYSSALVKHSGPFGTSSFLRIPERIKPGH
ncbi:unnamed protein product [Parajaminaea phylloscopi]